MKLSENKGMIALFALVFLVALTGMALGLVRLFSEQTRIVGIDTSDMKAFYLAEAGLARARYMLTTGAQTIPWPATGTFTESPFGTNNGAYSVNAVYSPSASTNILITSTGYYPNNTAPKAQRIVTESGVTGGSGGGANLSIGSSASASSTNGGNIASRAIDGNSGTYWRSNTNGNSWLRLDYGSIKTVNKVVLTGNLLASSIVQYSNNGTTWTTVSAPVGSFNAGGGTQTFTSFTARWIRLNIPTGNRPRVHEFQTYYGAGLSKGTFATSG